MMQQTETLSASNQTKVIKFSQGQKLYCQKVMWMPGYSKLIWGMIKDRQASRFSCIQGPPSIDEDKDPNKLVRVVFPYIPNQKVDLSNPNLSKELGSIILAVMCGQNQQFYSQENLLMNKQTKKLFFAPYSKAGLIPVISKTPFSVKEFKEVAQILTQKMLTEEHKPIHFLHSKLRAIGIFIIHMIMGKKVQLVHQREWENYYNHSTEHVPFGTACRIVQLIKVKLLQFLQNGFNIKRIDQAGKRDGVKYLQFLKSVFADSDKPMSWVTLIDYLIPSSNKQKLQKEGKNEKEGNKQRQEKQEKSLIEEFLTLAYLRQPLQVKYRLRKMGILASMPYIYAIYMFRFQSLNCGNLVELIKSDNNFRIKFYGWANHIIFSAQRSRQTIKQNYVRVNAETLQEGCHKKNAAQWQETEDIQALKSQKKIPHADIPQPRSFSGSNPQQTFKQVYSQKEKQEEICEAQPLSFQKLNNVYSLMVNQYKLYVLDYKGTNLKLLGQRM